MPGNSSWMPYAPQRVKGFDDDDDDDDDSLIIPPFDTTYTELRSASLFNPQINK